ncbi:MAG TPA: transporter [Burkholderiales bacterium]|nr:transporter [Burkholderiales bacterium]
MLVVLGAQAEDGELRLGGGFHYSTGDYGSTIDTRISTLEATARYETGNMVYRASVPWLTVKGDTGVIPGIGEVSGAPVRSGSASGLGDIVLSAAWTAYYDAASTLGLDLAGKLKLPTADESKGLGTGEPDFAFLADLYRTFDRVTGFGGVGYHVMGDAPGLPLENAWSANLGATYRLDARTSAGGLLEGRQRVVPGGSPTRELLGFWTRRLEGEWRAQIYGLIGLADGSPDWGFGLSLARPL